MVNYFEISQTAYWNLDVSFAGCREERVCLDHWTLGPFPFVGLHLMTPPCPLFQTLHMKVLER
jgi:hypothetical protein